MRLRQCIRWLLWWPFGRRRTTSTDLGGDTLRALWPKHDPIYGEALAVGARARQRHD